MRHEIGYLSHFSALPEEMTVAKALGFYGEIEQGDVGRAIDSIGVALLIPDFILITALGGLRLIVEASVAGAIFAVAATLFLSVVRLISSEKLLP
ncbi:MAG: hypothetical protein HY296_08235 [Thaumarchaeota archaeon]|nr:hypothetical protein [Nitrososphaerota archaeon]